MNFEQYSFLSTLMNFFDPLQLCIYTVAIEITFRDLHTEKKQTFVVLSNFNYFCLICSLQTAEILQMLPINLICNECWIILIAAYSTIFFMHLVI